MGWAAQLDVSQRRTFLTNPRRKLSASYAAAELLWYLSRSNRIDMIKAYAPQYVKFSDDGETANGAYGHRIAKLIPGRDQLDVALRQLAIDDNSRQVFVTCWSPFDMIRDSRDKPCTIGMQFLRREKHLDMTVFMRSNDVWLGMPYDVFCFTSLQRLVANTLDLHAGTYTHMVGSLHLYDRNREAAEESLTQRCADDVCGTLRPNDTMIRARYWVELERDMRVHGTYVPQERGGFFSELYSCCVAHFHTCGACDVLSPALRSGLRLNSKE